MANDDFLSWLPAELLLAVAEKLGKDITSFSRSCRLALQTWEALGLEPDCILAMLESELQDEHQLEIEKQPQGLPSKQLPTAQSYEALAPEQVRPRQLGRVAAAAGRRARLFANLPGGWERAGAMVLRLLREPAEWDWDETPLSEGHMARATVVAAVLQLTAQLQQTPGFSPQLARELLEAASGPVQRPPREPPGDIPVAAGATWLPNAALLVCGRHGWEDAARTLLGQMSAADNIIAPHERARWTSCFPSAPLLLVNDHSHLSSLFRDEDLYRVVSRSHRSSLRCLAACLAAQGGHMPTLEVMLSTGPALPRDEKDCVLAVALACGRVEVISHLLGGAWSQPLGAPNSSSTAGFVLAARRGLAAGIRHMLGAAPSDYRWFAGCVCPALCVASEEVVPDLVNALVRWREARAWLKVGIREALSAPADLLVHTAPAGLLCALEDPDCCSALEKKGVDLLHLAALALCAAAKYGGAGTVQRAGSCLERCSGTAGKEPEEAASDALCTAFANAAAAGRIQEMAELYPSIVRRGLWWELRGVCNALQRAAGARQAHALRWLLEQEQEEVPRSDSDQKQPCSPAAHALHIEELRRILLDSVQYQRHEVVAAILQSPSAEKVLSSDNAACELMEEMVRAEDLQSMACLLQCPSAQLEPLHLNRALLAISRITGRPRLAERQLATCRLLLEAGASVAKGHGAKSFVAACAAGNASLVALFLERGANPGRERGRPLWVARKGGHEAVVRVLEAALAGGA